MRTNDGKATGLLLPAAFAATCLLTAVTAVNAIAELARAMPHVGDIIAFTPTSTAPAAVPTHLIVHRPDQFGCVLDLGVLARSGGSVVVESQTIGQAAGFRVHWAGPRTSADSGDCGSDTDLLIDHHDLDVLALAAGGFGVGIRRVPMIANEQVLY
jgi:hypothetical protein